MATTAGTWSSSARRPIMSRGGPAIPFWRAPSSLLPWLQTHTESQAPWSSGSTTSWLSHSSTYITDSLFPWTWPFPRRQCQKKGRRWAQAHLCHWSQGATWKVPGIRHLLWSARHPLLPLQLLGGCQGPGRWPAWLCGRYLWKIHLPRMYYSWSQFSYKILNRKSNIEIRLIQPNFFRNHVPPWEEKPFSDGDKPTRCRRGFEGSAGHFGVS